MQKETRELKAAKLILELIYCGGAEFDYNEKAEMNFNVLKFEGQEYEVCKSWAELADRIGWNNIRDYFENPKNDDE